MTLERLREMRQAVKRAPSHPYSVMLAEALDAYEEAARERGELQAARFGYASEFPDALDADGFPTPDVGSIHQNIRGMKAKLRGIHEDAVHAEDARDFILSIIEDESLAAL
jgi:hypothetical protein